jgi:peptidylprolyl isomerase
MKKALVLKGGIPVAMMLVTALTVCADAQTRPSPQPVRPAAQPAAAARPSAATPVEERAGDAGVKAGEVVARVGTNDVTAEEVRAAIALMDPRQQAALARDPALLSQTVRSLLANRLVLKEATAKKWEQQPAVAAQLARARENLIVESYIQSLTAPADNYPSDADVKAVYEANASAFLVPRRFQLAQIVIAVPKDAEKPVEEEARKKLDEVSRKLRQPGADFGAIARASSEEKTSADRDGEIGWVSESEMRPEIRAQVAGLSKAAVTEPVRLDDGRHILKLLDTEASRTRALSEVRDPLVERIRAERAEANRRAYLADLLKQTPQWSTRLRFPRSSSRSRELRLVASLVAWNLRRSVAG